MALLEVPNLGTAFKGYFEVVPALTDELREHAYRIRHQVYCEELGFEPARADHRERDDYDVHALHCLIRSVQDNDYVACTRLVLARPGDPLYPLPFEKICAQAIDRSIIDPRALPRHKIAEVSRLAVVSGYRRRLGEYREVAPLSQESFGTRAKPRFPYLIIGLYLGTVELAALHGIESLFILTEPKLAKHFARLGVEVTPIGSAVEHRGMRVPSVMMVGNIIGGLNVFVRPLYEAIAEEVRQAVRLQRGVH
ncbi:MAG TPA: PEP-CTERM/exosortase system-associated acyltransferase [Burkholderiales bacterium]|nr:PEP-CTERM/exosortase system-associated acyltransferase [Burkholderiales bacterium]